MAAKATTIKEAIKRWEDKTGQQAATATDVSLIFQWPPIEKMDSTLACLTNCEKLSLSTNLLEKAAGLNSLKKLRVLSLGRNYIKSFAGMMSSECVKEEAAWEAEYVERLWAELYGDHEVKPDLVLGPETIQAQDIALPFARGCAAHASNIQLKNEATQDLEDVSATHSYHEDGVSNMPMTEPTQNPKDISKSLEDASASNTPENEAALEPGFVSTTHSSIPDVSDSEIIKTEATQNARDISTSLEDCGVSNAVEKEATREPRSVFTSHTGIPEVSDSNILKTQAMQNTKDISSSLEDASVSNTPETVEERESRVIFTTNASIQKPSVRTEPSIRKTIELSLKPCYVKLERMAYKKEFICQICQKICNYKHNLMYHMLCHTQEQIKTIKIEKKLTKKGKFNCHICGKVLLLKHSLVQHIKNHTKDPFREQKRLKTPKDSITKIYYTCDICGMSTVRRHSLIRHMKMHAKEEPFTCEVCKKQFRVPWELVDHMKLASCEPSNEKLMVDPPCNKRILQDLVLKSCYVSLERIVIENKGTTVKMTITETVDIYSESDDSFDEDQVHSQSHTGGKPYCCDTCKRLFRSRQRFDCHKCVLSDKKPFTCDICKKQFKRNYTLVTHKRIHTGEGLYSCEICLKRFVQQSHLSSHRLTHEEKAFSCTICDKKFSNARNLNVHDRTHTGEKPYSCDICKKVFAVSQTLKIHIRSHTGEKPYKCKVCNKQFTQDSNLRTHMKSHEKKSWLFTCHVCEKKFQSQRTLNNHLPLHDRNNPYLCDVCGARFKSTSMLRVHARGHYGGELV